MKISEIALREWINPALTIEQMASQLTMAGLEVDSITSVAGSFTSVVVAKVLKTMPHPQADKLTLCQVDFGQGETIQVVCGASNVRTGLTVALAQIGALLPGGIKIKETKLRGELSQGMLCSVAELGIEEESDGIMELPDDAPIGADLREYMHLNDAILDIDLTPNRADCFSILGVAREIAVFNQLPLRNVPHPKISATVKDKLDVKLDAAEGCPQYYGRVIRNINPQMTTPLWLCERLRRSGLRAIHPVVDVMNYVMIELGQPMHAFDYSTLKGNIHVRYSQAEEMLTLLDGQSVKLQENTIIIADESKPLAIAGIMGGEESAVHAGTTDLFLESAFFTPKYLAGIARQYSLCTESSQRFERGIDPKLQELALDYATDLILKIVGGEAGPIVASQLQDYLPQPVHVLFNPQKVARLTGVAIPEDEMHATLLALGMLVDRQDNLWKVTVPSHRVDILLDVDLVEEMIRIYGYDKITTTTMQGALRVGKPDPLDQLSRLMGQFLSHHGYHEIISYSFVDPDIQSALFSDHHALTILNPISAELSEMRVSLWPGLISALVYNSNRQQPLIKLFEIGVIFDPQDNTLQEKSCIAGLLTGEMGHLHWNVTSRPFDFYDLKGELDHLLKPLHTKPIQFVAATHSALHPGKSAHLILGDHTIGWIGVLHPRITEALNIQNEVILFEIVLDHLPKTTLTNYKKISKFPSVRRDLSFLIDEDIEFEHVKRAVCDVADSSLFKSLDVFDVYTSENLPKGKKSLAIALTLQNDDRTLVDEEVNKLMDAVIKRLNQDFSITLRD